jgi:hypothetical protein
VTEGVGPCVRPLVDFPFGWCVAEKNSPAVTELAQPVSVSAPNFEQYIFWSLNLASGVI